MEIHPELRKAIKKNELIIFAGAGLSFNLINTKGQKIGGWGDLVSKILNYLVEETYDFEHLKSLVGRYDPIMILQLLEANNDFPKREIAAFTKEYFNLDKSINDYSLHKKLFKLSKKIITTNYDTAFEYAEDILGKNKAYKGRNYALTTHKDYNTPLLFKLHGCHESVDSMVLFPSDYKDLYENKKEEAEHPILVLKNIIINKTILFVGAGMGDYQINSIFEEIKRIQGSYSQHHFIISKSPLDSKLSFLTRIPIKDFGEINDIIDALLKIKEEVTNQKSPETERLEKELEEALDRKKKLENDLSSEAKRKESRAIKYFIEGLQGQLQKDFEKAAEKFEIAIDINPEYAFAYNNWGNALSELSRLQDNADLLNQSFEKYEEALRINPEFASANYNWGTSLLELGKLQDNTDLLNESIEKYKEALRINPEFVSAYNNWGTALSYLAQLKGDEELLKESFVLLEKAVLLGADSYNLACMYALTKNKVQALKYLELSLSKHRIRVDFVKKDTDWNILKADSDFLDLLEKYQK